MSHKTPCRRLSIGPHGKFLSVAMSIFLVVIAVNQRGWFASARSTRSAPKLSVGAKPQSSDTVTSIAQQSTRPIADFESELITVTPHGFEPGEITRPSGHFLLGVNNHTGLTDLSLMLVHESGRSVGGKRLSKLKTWRQVLDLQSGNYELREANHRDWLCRITITER